MNSIFATNSSKPPTKSRIVNGAIYVRNAEPAECLIYDKGDGSVVLNLDGYMICPLGMFTKRQIKLAHQKYLTKK